MCENSLDAVSDRDFAIEFTACAALIMTHLSRFSEELILWINPRFGFIDIADRFCTGSSIMPQKKNPDVPELVRGKTGRVNGHLVALLTLMKGQPLAYNKDNQEDKEPLFDTVETLTQTLRIYADMIAGIKVKPDAMRSAALQGYATATDLADYLVKKGFRSAMRTKPLHRRYVSPNSAAAIWPTSASPSCGNFHRILVRMCIRCCRWRDPSPAAITPAEPRRTRSPRR